MKKGIIALLLVLTLCGCSLPFKIVPNTTPTATPTVGISNEIPFATATLLAVETTQPPEQPTATPEIAGSDYSQSGISFKLPACLAPDAVISTIPAVPPDPNGGMAEFAPEHRLIQFNPYPLSGTFFDASVSIYPVAEYVQMRADLQTQVQDLTNLLASHPAALPATLPFLPMQYAAQVFHARESYIDFQNGSGIAFLTQYAQFVDPANNHDLFYTFQGLTSDGKYWISAFLPVNAGFLQDSWDSKTVPANGIAPPDPASTNYNSEVENYLIAIKALMSAANASDYTPDITCLDAFLQSLKVENP